MHRNLWDPKQSLPRVLMQIVLNFIIGASLSEPHTGCTLSWFRTLRKIRFTSHSSFVMVSYVTCTDYESDKIRFTSHSSFVMVSYVACTDYENDKIRFTSHSSFVMVSYVTCTDCENDKIRWTSYSTFHTSRVQTVSVEGSMK